MRVADKIIMTMLQKQMAPKIGESKTGPSQKSDAASFKSKLNKSAESEQGRVENEKLQAEYVQESANMANASNTKNTSNTSNTEEDDLSALQSLAGRNDVVNGLFSDRVRNGERAVSKTETNSAWLSDSIQQMDLTEKLSMLKKVESYEGMLKRLGEANKNILPDGYVDFLS